jgi:hypothetical protein
MFYHDRVRETAKKNHRDPEKAIAEFDALVAEISRSRKRASDLEAERRWLSRHWEERCGDVVFRRRYAVVKTSRDAENNRVYRDTHRANQLLGEDLLQTRGWRRNSAEDQDPALIDEFPEVVVLEDPEGGEPIVLRMRTL